MCYVSWNSWGWFNFTCWGTCWGMNKIAAILQKFCNPIYSLDVLRFQFHYRLFLRVQLAERWVQLMACHRTGASHDLAPVPPKINVMTFSKSHDIKVMTLFFRPTKQISWHSASNVIMTLISWHWGVDIRLRVNFWWRWRKIITIHA